MTLEVEDPGEIQRGEQSSGPIILDAQVVAGFRYANWALKYQLPKIEPRFSEIRGCHPGTINLKLDKALRFNNLDYTTPSIAWHPQDPRVIERFSLIRVQLEHWRGGASHKAWIYIPHNSPYLVDPFRVEVITMLIAGVRYGDRFRLHIPPRPHRTAEIILID